MSKLHDVTIKHLAFLATHVNGVEYMASNGYMETLNIGYYIQAIRREHQILLNERDQLREKLEAAEKLSTEVSNLLGAGFGLNDYWRDRMKKAIAAFEGET